jgi:hypothetical protein
MKKCLLALCCALPLLSHAAVTAAFTDRDITPDVGMEVPGNYGKVFSKRIHDPCKVRIAVFSDGTQRVALVGLDALMVPRALVLAARAEIHEKCGMAPEAIMIGASHSHSSGPIGMVQPGEFDDASPQVQELAYKLSSCADAGYLAKVRAAIVEGVVSADAQRVPVTLGFGTGWEPTVAFNRRINLKNGRAGSHPGKGNPENLDFAGPTDPQVGVIGAWNVDGELIGCIVNFACHATANGPWITANWPYYTEKVLQGYYGSNAKLVFLQGACGDVTQVNNLDLTANPESDAWSQLVGGRVGAEALKVLLGLSRTRTNEATLAVRQKLLRIPRRPPSPEHLEEARALVEKDDRKEPNWVWAKETLILQALIKKTPVVEAEVQAIQVGPVVCLSNPAEYFCSFGLELKKGSGFPMTFPVELANGCVGYVPNDEAFGPHGGGYETRLTSYSNLDITAGDQFRDAGLELAKQLKPDPLPQPPPAPPFRGNGWTYGSPPPQLK